MPTALELVDPRLYGHRRLGQLDLSTVPFPDAIKRFTWQEILATLKTMLLEQYPDAADVIEDNMEPLVKLLQTFAAREVMVRADANDQIRAVMLALSWGSNLDQMGANYGIERMPSETYAEDDTPEIRAEKDERFRKRVQLAPEAFATAGSREAWIFHILSSHDDVIDAQAYNHATGMVPPGHVLAVPLIREGADEMAVIEAIREHLYRDDIVPLTDELFVRKAVRKPLDHTATLHFRRGPDTAVPMQMAAEAFNAYLLSRQKIGLVMSVAGRHDALVVPGVEWVTGLSPAGDLDPGPLGVYTVGSVTLKAETFGV